MDEKKHKKSIFQSDPHEGDEDEKEMAKAVEKVAQEPFLGQFQGGDRQQAERLLDVSFGQAFWGNIKKKWYIYIPITLLVVFFIVLLIIDWIM